MTLSDSASIQLLPPDVRARALAAMRDASLSDEQARETLRILDEEALLSYGVDGFNLNFLSLFGEQRPPEQIRALAVETARSKVWGEWELCAHFARARARLGGLSAEDAVARVAECARLTGWEDSPIETLLAAGHGVIVCIFHIGAYRLVPSDLTALGYDVTQAVDARGLEDGLRLLTGFPDVIRSRYHGVNIEQPGSSVALIRPLRHGGILAVNVDGNTGVDGRWGTESRSRIQFAGFTLLVKNGVARLAAMAGAPLVPVVALRDAGVPVGRLVFGPPIVPAAPLRGEAAVVSADAAMAALYGFFEPHAIAHPEQWESAVYLHTTRVHVAESIGVVPDDVDASIASETIQSCLARGDVLRANARRVVRTETRAGEAWIDARTLRTFRLPERARGLLRALGGAGVDAGWLDAFAERVGEGAASRTQVVGLLAQLHARGLVLADDAAHEHEQIATTTPRVNQIRGINGTSVT